MPPIRASRSTRVSVFEASRKLNAGRGRAGTNNYQPRHASMEEPWRDLDSLVFGADRSHLLERLARFNPPRSISQSYLFTRPGRVTAYLGPCVSDDQEGSPPDRGVRTECSSAWSWDLFPRNQDAVALARDLGFSPKGISCAWPVGRNCAKKNAIYAIAGFELG